MQKIIKNIFFVLVCLSVTAAVWVFKDLLFPFVTSKAFFFRIAIELAFPLYLYLIVAEKKLRPNLKNPLSLVLLVFLIINIIAAFTGVNVTRSLWGNFERMGGAFYLANLVALYFYVLALGQMQGQYLQRFLKFLLFMALVITGNGIFGWLHLPTFVQDPSLPVRISSTLGNPIYLGSYLIIPFYTAIFFALQSEIAFKKAAWYFLSVIFLIGIFLSGTRGAVVGLIVGSFFCALAYLFFNKNKKVKTYGFAGIMILVAIFTILFFNSNKLPEGSIIRRVFKLKDSNTDARLVQWKIALTGFKDRPILGTGSENYYIIANKYYDTQIFQYDRSWFDKPHNYWIEILVTNGVFGLLAYLTVLVFMGIALFKGFKAGFYGLAEFAVLLGALLAYQIQNLTVFDTVPASLMFYSFAGFLGYIWNSSNEEEKNNKVQNKEDINQGSEALPFAVLGVSFVVMAYAIYATNIAPAIISKNVNYGYAYQSVDPNKALDYFTAATTLPFNFDRSETASKFSDFAQNMARNGASNPELANQVLTQATNYLEETVSAQPDNPILWQRLYALYLFKSTQIAGKILVNPDAKTALQHSIDLAPEREENFMDTVQIEALEGNLTEAEATLKNVVIKFSGDQNAKAQLALVERSLGNLDLAVSYMEQALAQGYNFPTANDSKWLIDYYVKNKQFSKAVPLQEQATKLDGQNVQEFIDLAKLYGANGQKDQAVKLAQSIMNYDTSTAPQMKALIDSVLGTASGTPANN